MKRKFVEINPEGPNSLVAVNGDVIKVKMDPDHPSTAFKKVTLKLKDTGNGFVLTLAGPKSAQRIDLDYSEAGDLLLALSVKHRTDPNWLGKIKVKEIK